MQYLYTADGASSPSRAYTTEEYLKITEEQLKASAAQQQGQTPSPAESQSETQTNPQGLSLRITFPSLFFYCFLSLSHEHVTLITATVETPSSQQSGRET